MREDGNTDEPVSLSNRTEKKLWSDFKSGNKDAFAFIYTTYFHILFRYGKKIKNDEDLIQDCIQEVFIELLKKRENLSETDSIKYYLFKSLRRKISNTLIKQTKGTTTNYGFVNGWTEDYWHEIELPFEVTLINDQVEKEQREEILRALDLLTKSQRKAVYLKFFDNLSYAEIATEMSVRIDSVYNLISKASFFLKSNIKKIYTVVFLFLMN